MLMAQRPYQMPLLNTLLNSLDRVFHDPAPTNRRQIVSALKLNKGDATFSTQKRILGWDIDAYFMTLSLPAHRLDGMSELIHSILHRKRVSRTAWQRLLGTLRSTSPALYGAKHLFSMLQHALREQRGRRIRLTALLRASLIDWTLLATNGNAQPVPLHTVVPHPPHIIGATDASKQGMGGFYITQSTRGPDYYLWRAAFPSSITNALTSPDNPTGLINNSDLELAGLVLGSTLIAQRHYRPYQHISLASDNTPAVAWVTKGSNTSNGPPAYLLHMLAQSRRSHKYQLTVPFTTGLSNTIADCCSRLFHLNDKQFLQHMRDPFPIKPCWKLAPVPTETLSATNSAKTALHASRRNATDSTWDIRHTFCEELCYDPFLQDLDDPTPLLQTFAHRYRQGTVAPSRSPVKSRTVEGALRAIGQTLATLGSPDPRLQPSGKLDLCLSRQLTAYKKQDPAPTRVKPIPLPIITQTAAVHRLANTPFGNALADMLILRFFFLL
jgi:hypothetical protein